MADHLEILSIATTYPRWSGDSEPAFVHDLNRHLVERGHRVTSVVPHAPNAHLSEWMDGVRVRRFRYAPEPLERLFYSGGALPNLRASWAARMALPSAVLALRRAIRTNLLAVRPDVLHVHWLVPQGYLSLAPAKSAGIPLLVTAHGADVHATSSRWPLRQLMGAVARGAGAVSANTADTADRIRRVAGSIRCHIIPMGLDLQVFGGAACGGRSTAEVATQLLAVGRLVKKKGFSYLLDAMPTILATFPQVKLVIAGDGPLRGALESQAHAAGLDDAVRFVGPVDRPTVARLMGSSDIFVGPSIVDDTGDTEGQGVVFIEAMACGLPIVATNVGGIPDVVQNLVTGLLVPPKDPAAIARAVIDLVGDPERRGAMRTRGRADAADYAWPAIAESFEGLMSGLVHSHSKPLS